MNSAACNSGAVPCARVRPAIVSPLRRCPAAVLLAEAAATSSQAQSKAAKKNEKRKEKKAADGAGESGSGKADVAGAATKLAALR